MSIQLLYWWIAPILLVVGVGIVLGFLFLKKHQARKMQREDTVLVANSVYMRETPAYQNALRKLWAQVLIAATLLSVMGAVAAVGSGRFVDIVVEHPQKHNRDIVLCLDASGSMFDVNSEILKKFQSMTETFKGERIGLTVFNATSIQIFPLTDDYEYIQTHLTRVNSYFEDDSAKSPEQLAEANAFIASTLGREDGASLIGDGLYGCTLSFDERGDEERSRSIILATDNMVNGAELVPFDEAGQIAVEENIRVYGISPGSRPGVLGGTISESATNEMRTVVESTEGQFFELSNLLATDAIIDSISQTETSMIEGNPMIVKADVPLVTLYTLAGGMVLLFGFLLWRRM